MNMNTTPTTQIRNKLINNVNYLSLNDITKLLKVHEPSACLHRWLSDKNTLLFIKTWERIHNPNFCMQAFHKLTKNAGLNNFYLGFDQLIEKTATISLMKGIFKQDGVFAVSDMAIEFACWLSPVIKMLFINRFQKNDVGSDDSSRHIIFSNILVDSLACRTKRGE